MELMKRFVRDGRGGEFDGAPVPISKDPFSGRTFRGGSADPVHFNILEISFEPLEGCLTGLFESSLGRLGGRGPSSCRVACVAVSRWRSMARPTSPSALIRMSRRASCDAFVNMEERRANFVSVSSSPSSLSIFVTTVLRDRRDNIEVAMLLKCF